MFALKDELEREDHAEEVWCLADLILGYLKEHSDAADSSEGIRDWWLNGESFVAIHNIEQALGILVTRRLMQRTQAADGISIYSGVVTSNPRLELVG